MTTLLFGGGASSAQQTPEAAAQSVRALFTALSENPSPGVAVAVVRDGEVLFTEGYGLASLEHNVPNTSSTVFDLASLAKQFTGLAVAMLVEQGRISLDDDVREYIPELPDFGHTITVDHLLHHTSGLRDWPGTLMVAGWNPHDVYSSEQVLRMASNQQALNFEPGSEYSYSNTGYVLLAELVARVTGQSFREWTEEHIFRPLGMTRTHFHDDRTEVVTGRANGYWTAGGSYHVNPNNTTVVGSSSLLSTGDDMARWLINFDHPISAHRSGLELMRTRGILNDGSIIPYAFGLSHGEHRGAPTLTHSGGWASFQSFLVHFPEQRFGVVVLSNGAGVNVSRAAYQIADAYLEGDLAPRESPEREIPARVEVAPSVLDAYVGLYRLGPGRYYRIQRAGSQLMAQYIGEDAYPMAPVSETGFVVEAYRGDSIVFERNAEGVVTGFLYEGTPASRIEDPVPTPGELSALEGEYVSYELKTAYTVEVEEGALLLRHLRQGSVTLTPWGREFVGEAWFPWTVEFVRDDRGRVKGLLVNAGGRNRNLRFEKQRQPGTREQDAPDLR